MRACACVYHGVRRAVANIHSDGNIPLLCVRQQVRTSLSQREGRETARQGGGDGKEGMAGERGQEEAKGRGGKSVESGVRGRGLGG